MGINKMRFCFLLLLIAFCLKGEERQAQEKTKDKNVEIYFYYSNYGKIYGLFYLSSESKLVEIDLSSDKKRKLFHVFTKNVLEYDMNFYDCMIGADSRIYYGKAKQKKPVRDFEIFSSSKNIKINKPGQNDERLFKKLFNECVKRGEGEQCVLPKLLYTSDLNNDKRKEYWFIQPRMWEDGFSVVEIYNEKIVSKISSCPCCD